jgi:hypothetical protein
MSCRGFFCLVFLEIATLSYAATVPVLTVLSPSYAISSGQNANSYYGDSPTHIVAYATSPDCVSGISAIQIYTADGVLAYSSPSSYIDVQLALSPNFYQIDIKAWDNCGGVANDSIEDYVQSGSGQVTVSQPIANFPYSTSAGVPINATATTTCPQGVSAMGVYDAPHQKIAGQNGANISTSVTVPAGTTSLVIEEWDNCGGAATTTVPITLSSNGFASSVLFAYMPDASTGTAQGFYAPYGSCALTSVLGNPSPAHYDPISVAYVDPYLFVLNQNTKDISIYFQDYYGDGSLIQVPGSPFSLNEPADYTPTGIAVPGDTYPFNIFVSNKSTNGSGPGSIGEYTYNETQFSEIAGSPLVLNGNAQPTSIYVGGVAGNEAGGTLYTANGSSISEVKGTIAPPLTEVSGSPFPAPGRYGDSAGVQDIAITNSNGNYYGFIYTANSEGTISGFTVNSDFQLTQVPGSPFVNPDYTSGSTGNPASVAVNTYVGTSANDLYALNAGAKDIGVFSVNQSTGVLTYSSSEQKGLVHATAIDRVRYNETFSTSQSCLITSNGYAMSVNTSTGVTTLEPGSPFLGPGVYPDIALALY